jgi:hypothetical protein
MSQLPSPFSPIILWMRECHPANGPNGYTTCAGGRRCREAVTSRQPRSRSCSPAISQHSLPVYEHAGLTRRCSGPFLFSLVRIPHDLSSLQSDSSAHVVSYARSLFGSHTCPHRGERSVFRASAAHLAFVAIAKPTQEKKKPSDSLKNRLAPGRAKPFLGICVIWGNAFTLILRFFQHQVAEKHGKGSCKTRGR